MGLEDIGREPSTQAEMQEILALQAQVRIKET
jgi:hypothetical protein